MRLPGYLAGRRLTADLRASRESRTSRTVDRTIRLCSIIRGMVKRMLSTEDEHRELTDRVRSRTGRVEVDFANLARVSRHHGQLLGLVPAVSQGPVAGPSSRRFRRVRAKHPCSDRRCASIRQPISAMLTRLELPLIPSQPVHHHHSCLQLPPVAQRALPNDRHSPSCIKKVTSVPFVSFHVVRKFGLPEVCARRRGRRVRATCMPVPEAAVNEAHGFEASEHEVRSSGETPIMQSVSETASVKCPSKSELGLRAPVPDSRHHARPGGWIHYVRHYRLRRSAEELIRPILTGGLLSNQAARFARPSHGVPFRDSTGMRRTSQGWIPGSFATAGGRSGTWLRRCCGNLPAMPLFGSD